MKPTAVIFRLMGQRLALCLLGLFLLSAVQAVHAQQDGGIQQNYLGVQADEVQFYTAAQKNVQWCWAASVQMLLNYYALDFGQEEIMRHAYELAPDDALPDFTDSISVRHDRLNNWLIEAYGEKYIMTVEYHVGPPDPVKLMEELTEFRPVLANYWTNDLGGHTVLITAVGYVDLPYGPQVSSLVVRDPFPNLQNLYNKGRVEYNPALLERNIQAYWYINLEQVTEETEE